MKATKKSSKKGAKKAVPFSQNSSLVVRNGPLPRSVVFKRESGGRIRLQNREMVTVVSGTSAWNCISYEVNPGRAECFPWFSNWATSFDCYKVHGLKFIYTPITSTGTSAEVGIAFDYHVTDPKPSSMSAFSKTWMNCTGPCWECMELKIDCSKFNYKQYFTRYTGLSLLETADVGNLLVATYGSNTVTLGRLWVDYDIELLEPQEREVDPKTEIGYPPDSDIGTHPGPATSPERWPDGGSGWTSLIPVDSTFSGSSCVRESASSRWMEFPAGTMYAMVYQLVRANVNIDTPLFTTSTEDSYMLPEFRNCTVERRAKVADVVSPWTVAAGSGRAVMTYLLSATNANLKMGFSPRVINALASVCTYLLPYVAGIALTYKQYQDLLAFGFD